MKRASTPTRERRWRFCKSELQNGCKTQTPDKQTCSSTNLLDRDRLPLFLHAASLEFLMPHLVHTMASYTVHGATDPALTLPRICTRTTK